MVEKHVTESSAQEEIYTIKKQQNAKLFQTVTLIFLALFWVGYGCSLYSRNDGNINHYTLLILSFSLLNADVLFKGEKAQYKAVDVLAKLESLLIVVWVIITIVLLIIK